MNTRVHFNTPICGEVKGPEPAVKTFGYDEILELTAKYANSGWGERAVVCKSDCTAYQAGMPFHWGVVIGLRKHLAMAGKAYVPIEVRWVKDGSISNHWPEDLYLIHDGIGQADVEEIIRRQA